MDQDNLFSLVHPHFFDSLSRYTVTREYVDPLKALLPPDWMLRRWDVWVGAGYEGAVVPVQGFKIHVSSTPAQAVRTLEVVVPHLVRRGVTFKIAGDPRLLSLLISKRFGREGSGKFMTIYPPTEEVFRELIEALYEATSGTDLAGPYILSDRRYRDSRILHYRYGGMQQVSVLAADGTRRPMIVAPSGEYVSDQRTPYFKLPEWVEDPFGGTREVTLAAPPVLNGRYRVEAVLAFSNAGGVYRATDLRTERTVIIKEARPFSHQWTHAGSTIDAVALLRREHRVLGRIAHLGNVPEPIDLFTEWEHTFLVEGVVPGSTFQTFWHANENLIAPYVRRPGRVQSFARTFRTVALGAITAVERVHECGVIFGDLSPNNVLVDRETLEVGLIDFESAHVPDEDDEVFTHFSRAFGTLGFMDPRRDLNGTEALRPADDFYALGAMLSGAIVPVQNLVALDPGAPRLFLDRLIGMGVPARTRDVIDALLAGDAALARGLLEDDEQWPAAPASAAQAAPEPEPAYA